LYEYVLENRIRDMVAIGYLTDLTQISYTL